MASLNESSVAKELMFFENSASAFCKGLMASISEELVFGLTRMSEDTLGFLLN